VAEVLKQFTTDDTPVAVFKTRRDVRFGLGFYRDAKIDSYEENDIPAAEHILVVRAGTGPEAQILLRTRRMKKLGEFAPQHLEFFRISAAPPGATVQLPPGFVMPRKNTPVKK
jgi:hypothetical protein